MTNTKAKVFWQHDCTDTHPDTLLVPWYSDSMTVLTHILISYWCLGILTAVLCNYTSWYLIDASVFWQYGSVMTRILISYWCLGFLRAGLCNYTCWYLIDASVFWQYGSAMTRILISYWCLGILTAGLCNDTSWYLIDALVFWQLGFVMTHPHILLMPWYSDSRTL